MSRHHAAGSTLSDTTSAGWQHAHLDRLSRLRRVIREALVIAPAARLYFWSRWLMETHEGLAFANAETMIRLERLPGLDREQRFQASLLKSDWAITAANHVYIFGHWPVLAATMFWLVWKHLRHVALYRSALLISWAIGLGCFLMFPMAPPRLMADYGFVDTVSNGVTAYRVLQPPAFTNQFAAMPSLHVGWNLLMGIAILRHTTTWWARTFGMMMPLIMFLATAATANHFVVDGAAG